MVGEESLYAHSITSSGETMEDWCGVEYALIPTMIGKHVGWEGCMSGRSNFVALNLLPDSKL